MGSSVKNLEYFVEEVIYRNEETGFAVLSGRVSSNFSLIAAGKLGFVDEGEVLFLDGEYVDDFVYGKQIRVDFFERKLPSSERAIRKFLGCGSLKGVGPVIANRIVDQFGTLSLEVIETEPQKLSEVRGISSSMAKRIANELERTLSIKRLMIFLEGLKIGPQIGVRAFKKWGIFALKIVKSNPYKLCEEGVNLPFSLAEKVAKELKIEEDSFFRISCGIEYILRHNANENGHTCAPKFSVVKIAEKLLGADEELIFEVLEEMIERKELFCFNFSKEFLFLPIYYLSEKFIAEKVCELLKFERTISDSCFNELIKIEQDRMEIKFVDAQKKAIKQAISSGIFILSGGPGTGKTTILNAVISILEQRGLNVAVCAPTGRAAKRLCELTGKEATTIHRLLCVKTDENYFRDFVHNEKNFLKEDVVVVDEMSMVDCLLFSSLLKALKPGCSLILTGDYRQLPSVLAGNVFKNLLFFEDVEKVELKEIFRQSAKSLIVSNAHAIINNKLPDLNRKDGDFFFIERSNPSTIAFEISSLFCKRLPKFYGYNSVNDIQVICFSKKGLVGTVNLNKLLQAKINPKTKNRAEFTFGCYIFREGDKVMQIKNNYDVEWITKENEKGEAIYNGDIGFIEKIEQSKKFFVVNFDGKIVRYEMEMAKEIELAYAITVHKAQGNEFKCVVVPVFCRQTEFYSRNLLYTAITRAKENLVLIGSRECFFYMCEQLRVNYRYSGLSEFLKKESKEHV